MVKKRYLMLLWIGLLNTILFAQDENKGKTVKIIAGMGNYEYLFSGATLVFSNRAYLEAAVGIKPWKFTDESYSMGFLSTGFPFLKKHFKEKTIQPFLQLKCIVWNFENRFNRFLMLGAGLELRLEYPLSERIKLCGNAGMIYNSMLKYKRKTNEEVGWPVEYPPTFSLQLNFNFR